MISSSAKVQENRVGKKQAGDRHCSSCSGELALGLLCVVACCVCRAVAEAQEEFVTSSQKQIHWGLHAVWKPRLAWEAVEPPAVGELRKHSCSVCPYSLS